MPQKSVSPGQTPPGQSAQLALQFRSCDWSPQPRHARPTPQAATFHSTTRTSSPRQGSSSCGLSLSIPSYALRLSKGNNEPEC